MRAARTARTMRAARTLWTVRTARTVRMARLPARPLPMVGRDVLGAPRAPRRRIRPPQPHPGARERRATRRATIPPGEPPRQDAGRRGRRPLPMRAARTARPTWTARTLRQIVRAKGSAITGRRQSPPGRSGGWRCRKGAAQTGGPPRAATAEVRIRRRAARPEATAEVRTRRRAARLAGERRRRQRAAPLRRGNTSRAQSKVSSSSLVSLLPVNSSSSMSARSS